MDRRNLIVGAPVLVVSTVLLGPDGNALSLKKIGGVVKKVATVVIQAYNWTVNTPLQIATAARNLAPLVRSVSPEAARGVEMVQKIGEQQSTMEARLKWLGLYAQSQGVPVMVNTDYQQQQVVTYADQSARPIETTSSTQDEIRKDPDGYVDRNAEQLADYVKTYPHTRVASTFNVPAGGIQLETIPASAPKGDGLYTSVLTLEDHFKLVSLFHAKAKLT